jgi:hypothetical protein
VVEARGMLHGGVLDAHFGPVETAGFTYGPEQAQREHRELRIVFRPGSARVMVADTFGYCGLAATFIGPYRTTPARAHRVQGTR